MNKQKPPFIISHRWEIKRPETEEAYLVPQSDWTRLRKRIERLKSPSTIFLSIGYSLLGVAATALASAITFLGSGDYKSIIFVGSGLCLYFNRYQRKQETSSRDDILDCMSEIEEKYPKSQKTSE
jgi:hypothetical protein